MAAIHTDPKPTPPPVPDTASGQPRRVGVEIEFSGLTVADSAALVHKSFGGTLIPHSEHRFTIEGTPYGDFTAELDAQIVHKTFGQDPKNPDLEELEVHARAILGHAISIVVPAEIVTPPQPWNTLGELTPLIHALRAHGAEGTEDAPLFGFGLHLNPEVGSEDADWALRHLQAFVILEEWLRDAVHVDATRKILPHIDPFEDDFKAFLLRPDYAPDTARLIRDYVRFNPTRNRGLDMLPLFRHLDEATLTDALDDLDLVKARPALHYRLPNASLGDETWNAVVEWNRWVEVEMLAADEDRLAQKKAEYLAWLEKPRLERWGDSVKTWFASLPPCSPHPNPVPVP